MASHYWKKDKVKAKLKTAHYYQGLCDQTINLLLTKLLIIYELWVLMFYT